MSDGQATAQGSTEAAAAVPAAKWPAPEKQGVSPPITQLTLANAAARAAATNSRRDLVEYLRLRRKPA